MKSTLQIFTPTMHQESGRMNTRLERNHINLVHYLSIKLSQKVYHQYHHFLYPLSFSQANKRLIAKYEEEGDSVGPLEVFSVSIIFVTRSWNLFLVFQTGTHCHHDHLLESDHHDPHQYDHHHDYHQLKVNRAGWHCSWCFKPEGIRKKLLDAPRCKHCQRHNGPRV